MMATPSLHHVAVQTADLDNSVSWYVDYFRCQRTWTTEEFSELTLSRLPGTRRLTELVLGDTRFHVFERDRVTTQVPAGAAQFQHVCLTAGSPDDLRDWRQRWLNLYASGRYRFLRPEPPSPIVVDDDGVESFYFFDVDGLEFEFTWTPEGPR